VVVQPGACQAKVAGEPKFESWRVWASDEGRLYATRTGLYGEGSGTTVTATGIQELQMAMLQAQTEAAAQRDARS
jgi:hypothetical protein